MYLTKEELIQKYSLKKYNDLVNDSPSELLTKYGEQMFKDLEKEYSNTKEIKP